MKILIICSSVIPCGGTEKAISNMAKLFSQIGNIETSIVSISSEITDIPAFDISAPIIHLGMNPLCQSLLGKIKWYYKVIPLLKNVIKKNEPDIILSIGHNISFLMPFVKGERTVYACEHIDFTTIPQLFRLCIKLSYKHLAGIIVLSNTAKEKMKSLHNNIIIIPNSINVQPLNPSLHKNNLSLIMVGRISPEKGIERIIPIANELKKHLSRFCIDIYGDGPMKAEIERLIRLNKLDNYIIMHGYEKNINQKYQESSILIMTSYNEALPMVIIEGNSYGLPVIAYENEGTDELIKNEENGYIIKSNDFKSFADKIYTLVSNNDKLHKMRNSSYKCSKCYSEDKIKSLWENLLTSQIK